MRSVLGGLVVSLPFYGLCGLGLAVAATFKRGASPRLRRWRYILIAGFIGTLLVGAPAFSNALIYRLENRYMPPVVRESDRHPENLIVVLTGGWFRQDGARLDVKISEDGWERLDAGVKLWGRIGGTLLFAGAPAPDGSGRSVAGAMADAARARGVPSAAVAVEPNSRNTYENILFSLPRLQAHREHLWLVTSAVHIPRAMGVAARQGLQPTAYPCFLRASPNAPLRDWLPSNQGPAAFEIAMHEQLGMLWYRLRGWL